MANRPTPELALGTANWGTTYGAPGREAFVDGATASALATLFVQAGHDLVDTASAYGESEDLVKQVFSRPVRVVTKISAELLASILQTEDWKRLGKAVVASAERVGVARFEAVLLHDVSGALAAPRLGREALEVIRATNTTLRVGVSVYTPEEAIASVERLGADVVQLPCSIADQRFLAGGYIDQLSANGVQVHVRSVFLNGTLLESPSRLEPPLDRLAPGVRRILAAARRVGATPLKLALDFAKWATGADAVVIGAFSPSQLSQALAAWEANPRCEFSSVDWSALAIHDPHVDPRTWR